MRRPSVPKRRHGSPLASAVLALVLLAATSVPARLPALAAQDVTPVASVEGITEYRLDNGLRVLLFPDASRPQTTVNITYLVGSRHEGYGETGMAHLLEHLLFRGTPGHPDITQELSERGARPNGTTSWDRTNYFETFPASDDNLEWALDLEADRMVNSFVSADDLASEMTVVRNEMEAGENNPLGVLMQRVLSTAYLWHNYGKSTIGARSDVENVPIERLQAFYRKYYQPDNALLVVAGRFDEERALELIREKFGRIPRPERTGDMRIWPTYTAEPAQDGERLVTLRRVGEEQAVMVMHHVPPGSHEDSAPVSVLAHVLGNAPSGRLYRSLVETGIAAQATAFAQQVHDAGPLLAFTSLRPDGDVELARDVLLETLDALQDEPVTSEEVERARAALLRNVEQAFNQTDRIALQLTEWQAMGDWRLFFIHRDRLEHVSVDDVNRVARAYLKPDNRTVGLFLPTAEPDRAEIPAAPDVAELVSGYGGRDAVAQGEDFDPSPANIEARVLRLTLGNGLDVSLLPKANRGRSVVGYVRLHFGDETSLTGRATAGSLAGAMLMRGTERRNRQELNDEIARLRSRMSIGGGATQGVGQFETTRDNLAPLLRLLAEVVREPAFEPIEFQVLKEQRLAALESQKAEPGALAQIELARRTNPRPVGHPHRTETLEESIAGVQAVTLEDARAFYGDFWGPQNGNLVVVGDFDVDDVRAVVEEAFGDWASPRPFRRIATGFVDVPGEVVSIETPDKANAYFVVQQNLRLREDHPDHPALTLAGYMIGGGVLNSRLARRIRQQEGISYGVGAAVSGHPVDEAGQFSVTAIHAPENAERIEQAFREEMEKVLEEGFTAEEVVAAKQGLLESRQLSRAQDAALAARLSHHLYFGSDMMDDQAMDERIGAVALEDVNTAVRRHLSLEKMVIVRAGDFAGTGTSSGGGS